MGAGVFASQPLRSWRRAAPRRTL